MHSLTVRFILVFTLILTGLSLTQDSDATPRREKASNRLTAEKEPAQNSDLQVSAEAALASISDIFFTGVHAKFEQAVIFEEIPVKVGAQIGFLYTPSSPKGWVIPIHAIVTHHFAAKGTIHPFLGLGLGVSISHVNETSIEIPTVTYGGMTFGGGSTSVPGATAVRVIAMVRAGLQFGETMYAEIPLGTVASGTYIALNLGTKL